ncbi:hypothetical protein CEP51_011678 [Fusarium floridanum]|uniref:FAD/NAD(P)-binding domain-containing protein n=1 Tax=Fusarium floridanum TaxID=1325733 RepID=A0A428R934_9HYPO|nr:hypothetical protein CEP51_011678 [Fusarium floridanum]
MTVDHRTSRPQRILVAGGGFAGLSLIGNLLDLCQGRKARFDLDKAASDDDDGSKVDILITIVDERDGYFHTIGAPLAMVSEEYSEKAWTEYSALEILQHPSVNYVQGKLASISPESKEAVILPFNSETPSTVCYDFFVAATGLHRAWPVVPQALTRSEFLADGKRQVKAIRDAKDGVVVIGGGAVGVEIAAEILHTHPDTKVSLLHSGQTLLASEPLPANLKSLILQALRDQGVNVMLSKRAKTVKSQSRGRNNYVVELADGGEIMAGHVVWATSNPRPNTEYLPSRYLYESGHVKVTTTLNIKDDVSTVAQHFAVGDIVSFEGIRRCSPAMQMGYCAAVNIYEEMTTETPDLKHFEGYPLMFRYAFGNEAILWSPGEEIIFGEEPRRAVFEDDLCLRKCWNYMGLGNVR